MWRYYRTVVQLLLALLCQNVVLVVGVCAQGYVDINGQCLQLSSSCPPNYGLLNGMCYPATNSIQCPNGQISVNGQCCIYECNLKCSPQTSVAPYPNQPITPCPNQPITPCLNQPMVPNAPCPNQPVVLNAPCPNQPVAPYPNQPVAPYPNQPVVPNAPYPNQPVAPYPNQPVVPNPNTPLAPCPNQPVAPYPIQPVTPNAPVEPCPNQPVAPYPNQPVTPSPNQPIAPSPNQTVVPNAPCPNQPLAPYPNQPVVPNSPCPNQPVAPCPNQPVTPYPNQPMVPEQPVTPCPNQPVIPYPTQPPNIISSSPPTLITTTPLPPPAPIVRCPEGTILIGGACRLIYCGKGVYINKRCIQTECPALTVWTGIKCAPPEPIVHSIVFNNTIVTHFNRTEPDVVVNNMNNLVVNASITLPSYHPQLPSTSTDCEENESEENCGETVISSTPAPATNQTNCCTVKAPRMCRLNTVGDRWVCYNRQYRRCGDFCIAPTIYLRAPQPRQTGSYMVLPPDLGFSNCRRSGTCADSQDLYDCSGCALGYAESCSSYCYQYLCPKHLCSFYDQRDYCSQLPGEYGCQEQDGCQDAWCSGGY